MAAARAFGAVVLLVGLVLGVPYLLVSLVGNPFPSSVPTLDEVRILLTQNGQGFTNFLIGTLAVIIWFIWLQLVVALIVEIVATTRHSETRRLPTAPGIQLLAARLVAAITLAATLATAPILAPAAGALNLGDAPMPQISSLSIGTDTSYGQSLTMSRAGHQIADQFAGPVAQADPVTVSSKSAPERAASAELVVTERAELWDLAEAAYGDGVSWKLIAQSNAGRHDADGVLITDNTEVVAAGTELLMPDVVDLGLLSTFGAAAHTAPAEMALMNLAADARSNSVGPTSFETAHTVEPGDSMWSVAKAEIEQRLQRTATDAEVGEHWVHVVDANRNVASGDVDLIYPGETLVMPGGVASNDAALQASEPEAEPDFAETTGESPSFADSSVMIPDGPADNRNSPVSADAQKIEDGLAEEGPPEGPPEVSSEVSSEDSSVETVKVPRSAGEPAGSVSGYALGLAGLGASMLAVGVVGAIHRRRDFQRRTRPQGVIARQPSTEAAAFEAAMVHASEALRTSQQGTGWSMLPVEAVSAMRTQGPLRIHAEETGRLHAVTVVDNSEQGDDWQERRIAMEETVDRARLAQLLERPIETLDGPSAEPGLAVAPTTLVIGTDAASGEAVLLDLASAGHVGLAGNDEDLRRFARTAVLDLAVSDRADDIYVLAIGVGNELCDLDRVHNVETYADAVSQAVRTGHTVADSTTPVAVISTVDATVDPLSVAALRDLGAVVVAPGLQGPVRLLIEGDVATMLPGGTTVTLAALDNDDYRCMAELVDTTSSAALEVADPSVDVAESIDIVSSVACPVEAGPIELKVLGPVEVAGAGSFSSLKAVDVVAYLAFHRQGVDADQIKTWVWPAFDPPTDKAFANVLSRARTGLGSDGEGSPYLSRAGADKTYRLSDIVTTDFDRFRALVALADEAEERAQTLSLLKRAIKLIRGVPFTGGSASSFAWADHYVRAHVEYTIDEAVHRCADLALELDDLTTARWAALKGHELVPGCEQCFRRRFLVASAGNNRSELRRAMADLERSASVELGEPEAVDCISGDLLDLYHELDQALVGGSP